MNFPKAFIDDGSDLGSGAVTAIFFGLATANDSSAVGTNNISFGRATCFGRASAIDSHSFGTITLQLVVQFSAAYFALLSPMGLLDVAMASNVLSPELEDANSFLLCAPL